MPEPNDAEKSKPGKKQNPTKPPLKQYEGDEPGKTDPPPGSGGGPTGGGEGGDGDSGGD